MIRTALRSLRKTFESEKDQERRSLCMTKGQSQVGDFNRIFKVIFTTLASRSLTISLTKGFSSTIEHKKLVCEVISLSFNPPAPSLDHRVCH